MHMEERKCQPWELKRQRKDNTRVGIIVAKNGFVSSIFKYEESMESFTSVLKAFRRRRKPKRQRHTEFDVAVL